MESDKTTIAVDFDGVLHSFSSGWTNPRDIPDLPVRGAIEWLIHLICFGHLFNVVIFSARIYHWGGERAMKKWLHKHGVTEYEIGKIRFVKKKPVCQFLLDDRVVCFKGEFPTDNDILDFKPWHGKGIW